MEGSGPGPRSANERMSTEFVKIFKDYVGRGPTKARFYVNPGLAVCLLSDTLTKAERTLVSNGHGDEVRSIRRRFQDAMRDDLTAVVEQELEQGVVGFLSDHQLEPDMAIEAFVLEGNEASSTS